MLPIEVWAPKADHVEIEWSVPESTNRSLGVQPADGAGVPESTN